MNGTIRSTLVLAALVATVSCGSSGSLPSNTLAVVTPLTLTPPPIYSLLGFRVDLRLTSTQIAALDSIAQRVEEENRALIDELQRTSEPRRRQTGALVVTRDGEPLLAAIRSNQREAGDAVGAILDEQQRTTVCRLFERPDRRGQEGRRTSVDSDSVQSGLQQPVGWAWCS